MTDKFLVVKWEWLEESLSDKELHDFYYLLTAATAEKPEHKYYVVNKDEPYSEQVGELIEKCEREKNLPDGKIGISKKELLKGLEELKMDADPDEIHAEAEELLLSYINDKDIKKVYEEVSAWFY